LCWYNFLFIIDLKNSLELKELFFTKKQASSRFWAEALFSKGLSRFWDALEKSIFRSPRKTIVFLWKTLF